MPLGKPWHFGATGGKTRCGKRVARVFTVTTYQEWATLAMTFARQCETCTRIIQDETDVPERLRVYGTVH